MRVPRALFSAGILLLGACASVPKPVDQLATSEASVRTAQEMGARDFPPAALQLQLATEELSQAQTAMNKGDNEKALGLLQRARADAELAIGLVKAAHAQAEAREAQQRLTAMQSPQTRPAMQTPPGGGPKGE